MWEGPSAVGGTSVYDSPQWLLDVKESVKLVIHVSQSKVRSLDHVRLELSAHPVCMQTDTEDLLPIWVALFNMGEKQHDLRKRKRLFRAKRLRVAAGSTWKMSKSVILDVPNIEASEVGNPYMLVVAAMAPGEKRNFSITVNAKALDKQSENSDLMEMREYHPPPQEEAI